MGYDHGFQPDLISNLTMISTPPPATGLEYFNRLPWERIVTWGLVFLVLYLLRDFFFIIFATFLICYFALRFSGLILQRIPEPRRTVGIQRATMTVVFVVFLLLFVALLLAIFPELFRQGRAVVMRAEATNLQAESEEVLDRTVGSYLYQRQLATTTPADLQRAINDHRASADFGQGWWKSWPVIQSAVQVNQQQTQLRVTIAAGNSQFAVQEAAFEQYAREHGDIKFDYATYTRWNAAYSQGEQAFIDAVKSSISSAKDEEAKNLIDRDFEMFTRFKLANDWLTHDPVAGSVGHYFEQHKPQLLTELAEATQKFVRSALGLPFQLGLAFLIAFLICVDAPNILNRVRSMRDAHVPHYYDEIALMMSEFGQLTGKAIEAQLVIGVFNTILSIAVLIFLGVENIYFLAALILLASLVPVVGAAVAIAVVCLMAMLQPDGSLTLAIECGIAISIVHAVTSLILSPLIYGRSFHLHPVLVIVILIIAEHFFGMWGLVLGVPVAVYLMQITLRGNVTQNG
jgi:predicted PurR-regulated permease PerM